MARGERLCVVCGKDQYRKRVWETWGKRVICYECGPQWSFWPDGSAYNTRTGPTDAQREYLRRARETGKGS